ncbi:restriction endonuclease subunit S [Flavobacterium sp. FPG59]|uniref:restriction endonuclease subunit S n=1 Tax=Flavobacterium sp. FPG59 TaxID=1929267 RepID=UPI000A3A5FC9|nr:restriction endonuclease subunit S [Flavobacterium sp. FPG59]OUD35393.1 hypothetical protein FPG59_10460 [Flavobacterium sp. FPG59]
MNKVFKYVPITDLLETIIDNRGKTVPTSEKGIPLIATNCIKHSSIYPTLEKVRYVNEETHTNWFRAHLEPNDILFVNKGTPGRVCLVPDPVSFCAAQDMMAFRCNDDLIDYKYLFAVLRSDEIQKKIENNHVGLVIPHLRKQDLSSILIPIRDRKEQELIGNFYVSLSEKIELNNRINAELEAMAKTLYDYWFVQFDFPDANGKPYKTSGGKMVWNEELNRDVPEGWEVETINEYADFKNGKGIKKEHLNDTGQFAVYGSNGIVGRTDHVLFSEPVIAIGRVGANYGEVHYSLDKCWISDNSITAQPVKKEYFWWLILILKNINYSNIAGGSAQPLITQGQLKALPIAVSNNFLIEDFHRIIDSSYLKLNKNIKENQELASLRDWLLPMLMNGQVSVGDVAEELGMVAEESARYGK